MEVAIAGLAALHIAFNDIPMLLSQHLTLDLVMAQRSFVEFQAFLFAMGFHNAESSTTYTADLDRIFHHTLKSVDQRAIVVHAHGDAGTVDTVVILFRSTAEMVYWTPDALFIHYPLLTLNGLNVYNKYALDYPHFAAYNGAVQIPVPDTLAIRFG